MEGFSAWVKDLYLSEWNRLYKAASKILGDAVMAKDIVQSTFEILIGKGPSMMNRPHLDRWLYSVVRNLAWNELTSFWHSTTTYLSDKESQGIEELPDFDDDFVLPFQDCLPKGLSESEEEILKLFFEQDLSHREISEMLSIEEFTSRARLRRAVTHCRNLTKNKKN